MTYTIQQAIEDVSFPRVFT